MPFCPKDLLFYGTSDMAREERRGMDSGFKCIVAKVLETCPLNLLE